MIRARTGLGVGVVSRKLATDVVAGLGPFLRDLESRAGANATHGLPRLYRQQAAPNAPGWIHPRRRLSAAGNVPTLQLMEDPRPPIVPGLTLRRAGENLEMVATKSGEFSLLASAPGMEVLEGRLSEGKRLTLVPFEPGTEAGTEAYYIISGTLEAALPGGRLTVGAGSLLVARDLKEPTIFQSMSEVRFLYVSSEPTFHQLSHKLRDLMRLAVEVEMRDGYTAQHCLRIQQLSFATGQELGLSHHRLHALEYGAYLHDLGKARVPTELLQKPGALTPEEWVIMKKHPTYGREMLERTFLQDAGVIVEQHHERSDGSGYPLGLSSDAILVESSIVAVADTYDAITTDRAYRKGATPEQAFAEITKFRGKHYPDAVVDAFFAAVRRLRP